MSSRLRHALLLLVASPLLALAQATPPAPTLPDLPAATASAPDGGASAVPNRRPPPRLRSVTETGDSAAAPGDLKPERAVKPQLTIPFGKKAPPPTPREQSAVDRGAASASTGVDDQAARCDAEIVEALRADCRAKLARPASASAPR